MANYKGRRKTAKDYRNVIPFSELTKREKYLYDNPSENKNLGYGGYYKWTTTWVNPDKKSIVTSSRKRCWFWRDKPSKVK